jgi:hypothetical protein
MKLKSITAKHLGFSFSSFFFFHFFHFCFWDSALACQCIGVMCCIIPHLRNHLQAQLPLKKHHVLLNDIDRVLQVPFFLLSLISFGTDNEALLWQDYNDHQNEIYQKFVSIMRERLQAHFKNIRNINWKDDGEVGGPFISLIKETATLHRVLASVLFPEQIKVHFLHLSFFFYLS